MTTDTEDFTWGLVERPAPYRQTWYIRKRASRFAYWYWLAMLSLLLCGSQLGHAASTNKEASSLEKAAEVVGTNVINQSGTLMAVMARGMEKAGGYIEQAVDYTVEQAPLVVKEYATWVFISSLIWAVWWGILAGLLIGLATYVWKQADKHGLTLKDDDWFPCRIVPVLLMLVAFWPLFGVSSHLENAAKAKFAPRVLLIEKASEVYKR